MARVLRGSAGAVHKPCHVVRYLALLSVDEVAVAVHRETRGGVADAFAYDLHVRACRDQVRHVCVSEIVKADLWESRGLDAPPKRFGQRQWMDRRPVVLREHQAGLAVARAEAEALGRLTSADAPKLGNRPRVDADASPAR